MASLFVIQGADQGKRFELKSKPMALGRDQSNPIRLHDTEVSRRHAEVRPVDDSYRIIDLGSANGTFVNGQAVEQASLRSGDRLQLGQTVMLFNEGAGIERDLTARVDVLSRTSPGAPHHACRAPGDARRYSTFSSRRAATCSAE